MNRRTVYAVIFTVAALTASSCSTPRGRIAPNPRSFRFTATADSREKRREFRHLLSEISSNVGDEGAFHISAGDVDPVPDNYVDLVREFGVDVVWLPVVGNHDYSKKSDIAWIRDQYDRLPLELNPGPTDARRTTYSFDYRNAHFVILDLYHGNESTRLEWLDSDLKANRKPIVIVTAHEPRFGKRVGKKESAVARDRLWAILKKHKVTAYVCGHSHVYSRCRPLGSRVWQIDVGNAGNKSHSDRDAQTFLDATVGPRSVRFDVWRGALGRFRKVESWSVRTPRRSFNLW